MGGQALQKELTKPELAKIQLYLLKGYSIKKIADIYGISISKLDRYLTWERNTRKRTIFVSLGHKKVSYYNNEFDYSTIPNYKLKEVWKERPRKTKKNLKD